MVSTPALAQYVTSPDLGGSEGNTSTPYPFTIRLFPSMRYQQVYGASDFALAPNPLSITHLSFAAQGRTPWSHDLSSLVIRLSTTGKGPGRLGLDLVFANNLGGDAAVDRRSALGNARYQPALTRPPVL